MYSQIYCNICSIGRQRKSDYKRNSGLHKHHITPKHAGGTDTDDNLTYLTEREHRIAHYLLWKIHNNYKDYCAAIFLKASIFIPLEEKIKYCSKGGIAGSKIQMENCIGIHQKNKQLQTEWASLGGKSHTGKKAMYKIGDKSFIRVSTENIQEKINEGYIFGSPIKTTLGEKFGPSSKRKKVTDGNVIYDSVHIAAEVHNVTPGAIVYRCKSKKTTWEYVSDNE